MLFKTNKTSYSLMRGAVLWIFFLISLMLTTCCASTSPINTPKGIAVMEQISLGGLKQWVLIRGEDVGNPILLFLHGGPGMPAIPFEHEMRELERSFIVAIWDQRGAGKSYSSDIPKTSMTLKQFLADTYELILNLLSRFDQEKLYLVGHSCGSILGVLTVKQHPELIHAYVGVSQIVNLVESEKLSYDYVLNKAIATQNKEAITELNSIQPPYRGRIDDLMIQRKWLGRFGGVLYGESNYDTLIEIAKAATEYSITDLLNIEPGSLFTTQYLWDDLLTVNFFEQAKELDIPVYFFLGKHDYTTHYLLAEKYFNFLRCKKGKQLIWFENSAHISILEEPDRFMHMLVDKVKAETYPHPRK
ncbi:MAG: alpha/beta hydrolase [Spirochaetales bacterium]|nr:alpha/beta hydrolase [Spirochaetales bacterium]